MIEIPHEIENKFLMVDKNISDKSLKKLSAGVTAIVIFDRAYDKLKSVNHNHNRKEILELLEKESPLYIAQIANKIKLSYRNTFTHIKNLEELGLVKTDKQQKTHGRKVNVIKISDVEKSLKELKKQLDLYQQKFFDSLTKEEMSILLRSKTIVYRF